MVESSAETVPATPVAASLKKKKTPVKAKSGAAKAKTASHPPTATMVLNAIKSLNERGGSSLQAIKKSISGTYKVEPEKFAPFIKKYLKSAVVKGELIQTKGKGASGSFKLPVSKPEPKKKAAAPKKKAAPKKEKSAEPKPKKAKASPKKPAAAKKAAKPKAASKPKAATTPKKAPSKAKATKATPAKKPKSPKPKKTVAKKAAPKKTIAKK